MQDLKEEIIENKYNLIQQRKKRIMISNTLIVDLSVYTENLNSVAKHVG